MIVPFKVLLAATLFGVGASICAHAAPAGSAPDQTTQFGVIPAVAFGAEIAALDPSRQIRIVLLLSSADMVGAEAFVQAASDPTSALYGHYLTPKQFAARFGARAADYATIVAWARSNHLTVIRQSVARTTLTLAGDTTTINRLFATRLASFQTPTGRPGFAPTIVPTMPAALSGKVSSVIGLVDTARFAALYRPMNAKIAHPNSGTGVLGGFSPVDLRSIYVVPAPFTPAATQSIAVFEQGGFESSDIDVYKKKYQLPDVPVIVKGVNGSGTGVVPGVDIEADLDIELAIGINRNLKQVFVYEDAIDPFPVALVDSLSSVADDDLAQTVSISYGFDEAFASEGDEAAVRTVALQMAAQGQTVFASSGDSGAYGNEPPALNASFPATDPFITAVGGTTLFNFDRAYAGEEAWNLLGLGAGATGGGVSSVFPIPTWQKPRGVSIATANGGSANMRNIPDVAAVADPQTGVSIYSSGLGGWGIVGGTSASSPIWAAFNSIIDGARADVALPSLGFFNPLLYKLGTSGAFGLRDIADGSNGNIAIYGTAGFNAGPGYDNTTGLGSINLGRYLYSVLTQARGPGVKPGIVHGVTAAATANSVTINWTGAANTKGYLVTIGVAAGNSAGPDPLLNKLTTKDSVIFNGLLAGTQYYIYIYSLNASGSASPAAVFFSTKAA